MKTTLEMLHACVDNYIQYTHVSVSIHRMVTLIKSLNNACCNNISFHCIEKFSCSIKKIILIQLVLIQQQVYFEISKRKERVKEITCLSSL